ncbi:MAG: 3-hydroxyacyl-CoA dehydrogenase, partial [Chloroflexi bacterium]|nr:3-hydroxyacyl-CoA dehydrogenase [Chloroflexota bacterium]
MMKEEGKKVPFWVEEMVNRERRTFYDTTGGQKTFYHIPDKVGKTIKSHEKSINLSIEKSKGNEIKRDWSASLIDLGDGVLNVEFHSILQPTLNPIDTSLADTINDALDLV